MVQTKHICSLDPAHGQLVFGNRYKALRQHKAAFMCLLTLRPVFSTCSLLLSLTLIFKASGIKMSFLKVICVGSSIEQKHDLNEACK